VSILSSADQLPSVTVERMPGSRIRTADRVRRVEGTRAGAPRPVHTTAAAVRLGVA